MTDLTSRMQITLTPEASSLARALKENNDRLEECAALLRDCHASIRNLPAEFIQKVGLESRSDLETGVLDVAAPPAGNTVEFVGHVDHQ